MAKKEITSRPGFFGTTNHYDSNGRKVGKSRPGLFGGTVHYDRAFRACRRCGGSRLQRADDRLCRGEL